jgi:hypothetical protein
VLSCYRLTSPLSSSSILRELCIPPISLSPCLWHADHVYSRAGAPPSAAVPSATASELVYPVSRELAWPPSWRSCSVTQGPGLPASVGLTCGRKILDSINDGMQMPCHSLLLVDPFHVYPVLPHALADPPMPTLLMHNDCRSSAACHIERTRLETCKNSVSESRNRRAGLLLRCKCQEREYGSCPLISKILSQLVTALSSRCTVSETYCCTSEHQKV